MTTEELEKIKSEVTELSWMALKDALSSPKIPKRVKISIATKIVVKDMPNVITGGGGTPLIPPSITIVGVPGIEKVANG